MERSHFLFQEGEDSVASGFRRIPVRDDQDPFVRFHVFRERIQCGLADVHHVDRTEMIPAAAASVNALGEFLNVHLVPSLMLFVPSHDLRLPAL